MVEARTLWLAIPRPVRALPADLAAVLALVLLTNAAVLAPLIRETPLRIPLGLAFVLFVPGYAFIAALFPEAGESPTGDGWDDSADGGDTGATDGSDSTDGANARPGDGDVDDGFLAGVGRSGIDGIERVALAFGLSIALVPLIGLVLNFTPWGIRLVPIMLAVSGFTVAATVVAAVRRWELPPEERFRVPYREWSAAGRAEVFEPETRTDAILNVLLAASVVLALGAVSFAIMVPPSGEQFSALYILTEDDDGELVAGGYPTDLTAGESAEIVVGVDNREHDTVEYTLVLVEQQVAFEEGVDPGDDGFDAGDPVGDATESDADDTDGSDSVGLEVVDQNELDRFEPTLAHNESWLHPHAVEPTFTGENVRLVWLLFPGGEVPETPGTDDTEYWVHLWVDVEATDGE